MDARVWAKPRVRHWGPALWNGPADEWKTREVPKYLVVVAAARSRGIPLLCQCTCVGNGSGASTAKMWRTTVLPGAFSQLVRRAGAAIVPRLLAGEGQWTQQLHQGAGQGAGQDAMHGERERRADGDLEATFWRAPRNKYQTGKLLSSDMRCRGRWGWGFGTRWMRGASDGGHPTR
ncbi:hypothetical protein P154DRAFT_572105 [Amniculicola lignicola CBS 123094]|uniref:Uncharacterized protein n=1 Tax=Amniculicola lignicola CBS 123094 TaxID=1392246 RepID=A0A6A5WZF2_9PLEO|nr:hypothetical protein P154DRAFT_572105 [Amniculicola lignicola CBS 123094]